MRNTTRQYRRHPNGQFKRGDVQYISDMRESAAKTVRAQRVRQKVDKWTLDIVYMSVVFLIGFGLIRGAGSAWKNFTQSQTAHAESQLLSAVVEDSPKPTQSASPTVKPTATPTPKPTPMVIKVVEDTDPRANKLYSFLKSKGSPLTDQSAYMLQLADEYDLPWTLIPSIAGKESSYGKNIMPGSFNPFGLGGAGSGYMYFKNWEEAILYEAKLLSNNYRWNMNKGIQQKYCPTAECNQDWAEHVTQFQQEILK